MKTRSFFAFLLALFLFSAVGAQTVDKAKLDQFFNRLAEKDQAMGSMVIARNGDVVYTRSIGYSRIDEKEKKPATAATKYRIGSIGKLFTAAMAFQLIEEGKLKLTDTLDKFFPQIPNAGKITMAHILSHRSGIHSFTNDREFGTWMMNPKTHDELVAVIAAGKPDFEPGEKYAYSNAAFVLMGYIVEKVGGKPYQQALKDRITSKIGLKNTYLGTSFSDPSKNESLSYRFDGKWTVQKETHLSIPHGAGAVISTPADLVKFIQAVFDLKIVSRESLDLMMQNKYGMFTFPLDGKTYYGHGGSIDGFRSLLVYLPEEKLAVAYTTNGVVYPANSVIQGSLDIYRNRPFEIPTFETIAVKPEVLDKYIGVYASAEFPLKITVTRKGDVLNAQAEGQGAFPLDATSEEKFKFDQAGIVLTFDAAKNQMALTQGGRTTVFTKAVPQ